MPTPEFLAGFSWVLYQFGRELHRELDVPVGLIQSTWGGTPIEAWIPRDAFADEPGLKLGLDLINQSDGQYEQSVADFSARRPTTGTSTTSPVAEPKHPFENAGNWPSWPTILYNGMIHPLSPFQIRGFLWYQGENNVSDKYPTLYAPKMKAMIGAWRRVWGQPDVPFYYVQLPPFHYQNTNDPRKLTQLWTAQARALEIVPNTAMAGTCDLGDVNDIHPGKKDEVARRLALIALARDYRRDQLVYQGPMYLSHAVEASRIRVRFRFVGGGLVSRDAKPLTWFQVAGEDREFADAQAAIDGDSVLVHSPAVAHPVFVRFGWANVAEPNLANREGLPAIPFSTELNAREPYTIQPTDKPGENR